MVILFNWARPSNRSRPLLVDSAHPLVRFPWRRWRSSFQSRNGLFCDRVTEIRVKGDNNVITRNIHWLARFAAKEQRAHSHHGRSLLRAKYCPLRRRLSPTTRSACPQWVICEARILLTKYQSDRTVMFNEGMKLVSQYGRPWVVHNLEIHFNDDPGTGTNNRFTRLI